jgi:hypothetical protein
MHLQSAAPLLSRPGSRICHSSRSVPARCIAAQNAVATTHTGAASFTTNTYRHAPILKTQLKSRSCVVGCQPAPWAAEPCLADATESAFVADAAPSDTQAFEAFPNSFQDLSSLPAPTQDLSALLHPLAHPQQHHSGHHHSFPPSDTLTAPGTSGGDSSLHNRPGLNGLTVGGTSGLATVSPLAGVC